eukprot:TRINITY_DN10039_c1_g1_i1.p1 TRINITY_DN10039_c1_g1~~TRINITY_DN10039_c1_g1_i1.p1  ORF type:complete len:259 (+),score=51.73 TRINITY_DN10039_c1_g1_i1:36-779(+)
MEQVGCQGAWVTTPEVGPYVEEESTSAGSPAGESDETDETDSSSSVEYHGVSRRRCRRSDWGRRHMLPDSVSAGPYRPFVCDTPHSSDDGCLQANARWSQPGASPLEIGSRTMSHFFAGGTRHSLSGSGGWSGREPPMSPFGITAMEAPLQEAREWVGDEARYSGGKATSTSFINSLERFGWNPACHGASSCSVCQEDYSAKELVADLPCAHRFHSHCIVPWLLNHSTCPTCRFELPCEDEHDDDNA